MDKTWDGNECPENLIKMTPKSGVDIVTNSNWKSIRKERFVDSKSNHMFVRVDHSDEVERCDVSQLNLDYDFIVISDYDKGFLTESTLMRSVGNMTM